MTTFKTLAPFDFRSFDPFALGFDDVFKDLQDMANKVSKTVSYPPYNIKQIKENKYVIEMAVAGFAKTDIEVTLEGNKLVVKGATKEDEADIQQGKVSYLSPLAEALIGAKLNDEVTWEKPMGDSYLTIKKIAY
jgi:HSP20 family molecular chaperone IbpA